MTFPEHLLKLRLASPYSQQAIADRIGVALRTYQYYERGQREPHISTLIALADLYGLSLDELVCRERVGQEPGAAESSSDRTTDRR